MWCGGREQEDHHGVKPRVTRKEYRPPNPQSVYPNLRLKTVDHQILDLFGVREGPEDNNGVVFTHYFHG